MKKTLCTIRSIPVHGMLCTVILLLGVALSLNGQQKTGTLVINADLGEYTISRHIYGHFSEHLGHCIYGGYWVGEDSEIPNKRGIRNDIVEALKAAGIPNLRWPGGCFADEYHWMDGIGPREDRTTMINTHWGGVTENNHFGTHEFLDLCEQLGAEPYICGNVGSGTVEEMSKWVEYVNFDGVSPMADLRRMNGRENSWGVKYWGVGNENWGCGGNMTAEFYADQYKRFATFCKNYGDHRLLKITGGANRSDYHWTETLMKNIPHRMMYGISLHHYTYNRPARYSATDFGEDQYFDIMQRCLNIEGVLDGHITIMNQYDPDKRVALVVDEWGAWYEVEPGTNPGFLYQQNTLRDAMVAALSLNYFNERCERIKMANLAQTVNVLQAVILTEDEKLLLTPTYHIFEMFRVHQDAVLLPSYLETPDYEFPFHEQGASRIPPFSRPAPRYRGNKLPMISASASRAEDGTIHVSLVNIDPHNASDFTIDIRGAEVSDVSGRILTAEKINSMNTFEDPGRVKPAAFTDVTLKKGIVKLTVPAKSIIVLAVN
jgi:alpha-N-arabinofuranosidase